MHTVCASDSRRKLIGYLTSTALPNWMQAGMLRALETANFYPIIIVLVCRKFGNSFCYQPGDDLIHKDKLDQSDQIAEPMCEGTGIKIIITFIIGQTCSKCHTGAIWKPGLTGKEIWNNLGLQESHIAHLKVHVSRTLEQVLAKSNHIGLRRSYT